MPMKPGVVGDAEFSKDDKQRWWLSRSWQTNLGVVLYVGLNPSKAGKDNDDMTVAKGMGFARAWGLGGTLHGNAFPYITTYPDQLVAVPKLDIETNDRHLLRLAKLAKLVVLAWGAYPQYAERFKAVAELLRLSNPVCVGRTKTGYPRHISRLGYDQQTKPWFSEYWVKPTL